jgi:hypothetical protein
MEGVLPGPSSQLVRLAHRTGRLKSCLGCSSRLSTKYIETCPDRSLARPCWGRGTREGHDCTVVGMPVRAVHLQVVLVVLLS